MVTPSGIERKGYFSHFKYSFTLATERWGGERRLNSVQYEAATVEFQIILFLAFSRELRFSAFKSSLNVCLRKRSVTPPLLNMNFLFENHLNVSTSLNKYVDLYKQKHTTVN